MERKILERRVLQQLINAFKFLIFAWDFHEWIYLSIDKYKRSKWRFIVNMTPRVAELWNGHDPQCTDWIKSHPSAEVRVNVVPLSKA